MFSWSTPALSLRKSTYTGTARVRFRIQGTEKETHCRISVVKNPRTNNCWEVTHRLFSDFFKRQTNAFEFGYYFRQDISYVLWNELKLYEIRSPSRASLAHVWCLRRSIHFLLPYRTSMYSETVHFCRPTFRDVEYACASILVNRE